MISGIHCNQCKFEFILYIPFITDDNQNLYNDTVRFGSVIKNDELCKVTFTSLNMFV